MLCATRASLRGGTLPHAAQVDRASGRRADVRSNASSADDPPMRRLHPRQPVGVSLDHEDDVIEARVSSVLGPVATLEQLGQPIPRVSKMLTPGALGFMTFDHEGMPVALRGVVRAIPGGSGVEFVVIDGIQLRERRTAARTAFVARVRATQLGGDSAVPAVAVDTATADLSLGGALLNRRVGFGHGPEWQIELLLTDASTADLLPRCVRARDTYSRRRVVHRHARLRSHQARGSAGRSSTRRAHCGRRTSTLLILELAFGLS